MLIPVLAAALVQAATLSPQAAQDELMGRLRCQMAARSLRAASGVPADLMLTVNYANGALLAGGDWPRGTRALIDQWRVPAADIERFETAEQPRFSGATVPLLVDAMRQCNARFGAATQYDAYPDDEE